MGNPVNSLSISYTIFRNNCSSGGPPIYCILHHHFMFRPHECLALRPETTKIVHFVLFTMNLSFKNTSSASLCWTFVLRHSSIHASWLTVQGTQRQVGQLCCGLIPICLKHHRHHTQGYFQRVKGRWWVYRRKHTWSVLLVEALLGLPPAWLSLPLPALSMWFLHHSGSEAEISMDLGPALPPLHSASIVAAGRDTDLTSGFKFQLLSSYTRNW